MWSSSKQALKKRWGATAQLNSQNHHEFLFTLGSPAAGRPAGRPPAQLFVVLDAALMQGGAGSRARADYGSSAAVEKTGLSMYAESPEEEVTLEDFEIWSFQRLKSAWPPASALAFCAPPQSPPAP